MLTTGGYGGSDISHHPHQTGWHPLFKNITLGSRVSTPHKKTSSHSSSKCSSTGNGSSISSYSAQTSPNSIETSQLLSPIPIHNQNANNAWLY